MSWFSFRLYRKRFSLEELRHLSDQLQKIDIVNEANKNFVIKALRSIAELLTYGDQNDSSFFAFFMEKQIMGEFARILSISRPLKVAVQMLQTMSIMIQNLRSEHAIYYLFSNECINYLITYPFDFGNEELLSYYISFLRAISGRLNRNTISLLATTENDKVVSFPLYTEAIMLAFHDENMVRIAVRALTLNIYHVGDDYINKYISHNPLANYFSGLVGYFWNRCIKLDRLISQEPKNFHIHDTVDEIEDNLYYLSDVVSAGVPELGRLVCDSMLQFLVFPMLLPSLIQDAGAQIGITTCLYVLCSILRIVKIKDLASSIAATLFFSPEPSSLKSETTYVSQEHHQEDPCSRVEEVENERSGDVSTSSRYSCSQSEGRGSNITWREILLSNIINGEDSHALGSLCLLVTLLQTKELDESVLDGIGILPQRKQHKKILLQALVGEISGEEQLFFSENSLMEDQVDTELFKYLRKLKDLYGLSYHGGGLDISPEKHRHQVLDALAKLSRRASLSAETMWAGGWLLCQLLPHGEEEFTTNHLKQLKDSHNCTTPVLFEESKGSWSDMLLAVLTDEWKNNKRA